jgi:hypothetical protein
MQATADRLRFFLTASSAMVENCRYSTLDPVKFYSILELRRWNPGELHG